MPSAWLDSIRETLLGRQTPGGGWGYGGGAEPMVEPTVLASLALLEMQPDSPPRASPDVHAAADWLARLQQPDGALGISARWSTPRWPTALGTLLWAVLGRHKTHLQKAIGWLLAHGGKTQENDCPDVIGHDTTIPGWSWVLDTAPWVEPTAMALVALRAAGVAGGERIGRGVEMLCDRAIPSGGWNYGNKIVFGHTLRPQPAPTGWALLALAGHDVPAGPVDRGCAYLEQTLPRLRSARSLAWGLLGLQAWRRRPARSESWLRQCSTLDPHLSQRPVDLALLLLASQGWLVDVLGPAGKASVRWSDRPGRPGPTTNPRRRS